ncbi:MAG: hypothetical protein BRC25_03670, partial [Parcubacteria group bacterium SW_6_46_9]
DEGDGVDQISNFKGASSEFNSDGSFFVQVEDGYEGDTVDYTYTVTDGEDSDRGQITVDVRDSDSDNQAPNASCSVNPTSGEGDSWIAFRGSGSSDPDGSIQSYTWDFDNGSTDSTESTGEYYTSPGTYNPTLTVTDDDGASDTTQCSTVTITESGQSPQASDDSFTTQENQSLTISADDLLNNDSNPGGGDLIVDGMSFPGAANGRWSVVDYDELGDGLYRINSVEYTPEPGYTGTWTFDYQAQDITDEESADTASVTVQVQEEGSQPPEARLSVDPSQTVDIGEQFTVSAEGSSDPDGDDLEYKWEVDTPRNSGVGEFSDRLRLSTSFDTPGTATFAVTVRDSDGNTDTDTIDLQIQQPEQQTDLDLIEQFILQEINDFPAAEITLGDVNDDGSVNAEDAQVIQRYANGQTDLSFRQKAAADVDGDGQISGN